MGVPVRAKKEVVGARGRILFLSLGMTYRKVYNCFIFELKAFSLSLD